MIEFCQLRTAGEPFAGSAWLTGLRKAAKSRDKRNGRKRSHEQEEIKNET